MLLSDREIRELSLLHGMISPFSDSVSGNGIISYGLTSAGYDIRLAKEVMIFKSTRGETIDPKRFKDSDYHSRLFDEVTITEDGGGRYSFIIPPHCYFLGRSFEYLRIPRHLKARCVGKSTLARSGLLVNTTPLEPSWEGHLVIELGNITPCPMRVYAMEGIAQIEFEVLSQEPEVSYADKGGKYQGQQGITTAKVL